MKNIIFILILFSTLKLNSQKKLSEVPTIEIPLFENPLFEQNKCLCNNPIKLNLSIGYNGDLNNLIFNCKYNTLLKIRVGSKTTNMLLDSLISFENSNIDYILLNYKMSYELREALHAVTMAISSKQEPRLILTGYHWKSCYAAYGYYNFNNYIFDDYNNMTIKTFYNYYEISSNLIISNKDFQILSDTLSYSPNKDTLIFKDIINRSNITSVIKPISESNKKMWKNLKRSDAFSMKIWYQSVDKYGGKYGDQYRYLFFKTFNIKKLFKSINRERRIYLKEYKKSVETN